MKNLKNDRRGFTLVELLAVIVILAILMVSAGAAVMSTLNNARVNTFKNEALSALNVSNNMYTEISMDANDSNKYLKNDTTRAYKGMCVTLQGLVTNGYLDKDVGKDGSGDVRGVILIEVPFDGGPTKKSIWMTNGTHAVTGYEESKISSLKFKNDNNKAIMGQSGGADKKYYDVPKVGENYTPGVVTYIEVADTVITAANGKVGTLDGSATKYEKPDGTTAAWVSTVKAYTSETPNIELAVLHSPSTNNGGTGLQYNNILCINSRID